MVLVIVNNQWAISVPRHKQNSAKTLAQKGVAGGLPETVAGMTMDRQCSSGLMTIATAAKAIMCNEYDVAVAGGVESISLVQTKHKNSYRNISRTVTAIDETAYMPMLETADARTRSP